MRSRRERHALHSLMLLSALSTVAGSGDSLAGSEQRVLTPVQGLSDAQRLGRAATITISPDGAQVYIGGNHLDDQQDDVLSVYTRDTADGSLDWVASYQDGVGGISGVSGFFDLLMSEDGDCLFSVGWHGPSGSTGHLAAFERDLSSGLLELVQAFGLMEPDSGNLQGPVALASSPDGRHIYLVDEQAGQILLYGRQPGGCTLSYLAAYSPHDGSAPLASPSRVAVSADGQHLYVSVSGLDPVTNADGLVVMRRDPVSGELSQTQSLIDGENGVGGLDGAFKLRLSKDQRQLYVISFLDNAISVFARDPNTGALDYRQTLFDGVDGIDGLSVALGLALSPNGEYVLVCGAIDSAVAVFRRQPGNGLLEFVATEFDGVADVTSLQQVRDMTFSPDGRHAYAASELDNGVQVFRLHNRWLLVNGFE